MANLFVFLVLLLGAFAGCIFLERYLSKKKSRWPGLVLPILSFLLSLLWPLGMIAPPDGITAGFVVQLLFVWLLANIPTMVFLAIYLGCREKQSRYKQLDKMNIQDLS